MFMSYSEFEINPFDNIATPQQELVEDESILPFSKSEIPVITTNDRIVRWLGGNPDQILLIYRIDINKIVSPVFKRINKIIEKDQKTKK